MRDARQNAVNAGPLGLDSLLNAVAVLTTISGQESPEAAAALQFTLLRHFGLSADAMLEVRQEAPAAEAQAEAQFEPANEPVEA